MLEEIQIYAGRKDAKQPAELLVSQITKSDC